MSRPLPQTVLTPTESEVNMTREKPNSPLCWFCEARPPDKDSASKWDMYKQTKEEEEFVSIAGPCWETATVPVPRCAECKRAHDMREGYVERGWKVGLLSGVAVVIVMYVSALWFILPVGVYLLGLRRAFVIIPVVVFGFAIAGGIIAWLIGRSAIPQGRQDQSAAGVAPYAKDLAGLGAGAWVARFVERELARRFVDVELGVAALGGASAPLLFLSFAHLSFFHVVLYAVVFLIGVLVGLEIPLLMRIMKDQLDFKELIARVLAFDYVGALIASLLFPIFLVPKLGLVRTSLLFGFLNAGVGLWATWLMRPIIRGDVSRLRAQACVLMALLAVGFIKADRLTSLAEDGMFADDIVYSRTSAYQRIVITRNRAGFQLFLNGNLQFSSADEYRYHEALVHPALALASDGGPPGRPVVLP